MPRAPLDEAPAEPTDPTDTTATSEQELWEAIRMEKERKKALAAQEAQVVTDPTTMDSDPSTQPDVTPGESVKENEEQPVEIWKSIKQEVEKKKEDTEQITSNNVADHHLP